MVSVFLQICIVFLLSLVSQLIEAVLPIPIPASIIGMVLLLVFLGLKWLKTSQIEQVSNFFLKNMGFFFLPVTVSLLWEYKLFADQLVAFLIVILVSTVFTFLCIAYSVQLTIRLVNRHKLKKAAGPAAIGVISSAQKDPDAHTGL